MNQFKKLRLLAGKSVEEAANEIGVNSVSIYKWEAGMFTPNAGKVKKIAKAYKCSVEAVVEAYEAQD